MSSETVKVCGESNGQKRITVPADSDIELGDHVMIEKVLATGPEPRRASASLPAETHVPA